MSIVKAGHEIRTLEDWRRLAPPKRHEHWQEYRSAMEAARAWLGGLPALPAEVRAVLERHEAFGAVRAWRGEPEVRVRIDARAGEPRNADLVVEATDAFGAFVIAVEAKADETFGETVAAAARAAARRRAENPRSRGAERLTDLCRAFFGTTADEEPALGQLRYQLLTATAGALAAARDARVTRAVMLVHEFRSVHTNDAKLAANAGALDAFVARLTRGAVPQVLPGRLYALPPVGLLRDNAPSDSPAESLFLAKVVRTLPS